MSLRRFIRLCRGLKVIGLTLTCLCVVVTVTTFWLETDHSLREPFPIQQENMRRQSYMHKSFHHQLSAQSVIERLQKRLNHTKAQCAKKWSDILGSKVESYIQLDTPLRIAQCFVAKAGSTYWGKIFAFLCHPEQMESMNITSPFDIDRVMLHHQPGMKGYAIRGNESQSLDHTHAFRFFFARDPYRRLWSTYLDKYYLPGYWRYIPLDPKAGLCQTNISFKTFLEYAVTSDDPHMIPVSHSCNPCVFKPDFIGQIDTFSSDTEFILQKTNYSYLLENYDKASFVEREIKTLVLYNVAFLGPQYRPCLNELTLLRMLWNVFQVNGYIKMTTRFPKDKLLKFDIHSLVQLFVDGTNVDRLSNYERKQQKHRYLVGAYRQIPADIIQAIQKRFQGDFELFDYDKNPPS